MEIQSVYLPNFTIGAGDVYHKIPEICARFGKKAVLVGGKTALSKAEEAIREGIAGSDMEITGVLWYGGDATMSNIEMIQKDPQVQGADMIFAIGGGRAIDACKVAADAIGKPIFTFPTIASNCAPVTKVCVVYHEDHSFKGLIFAAAPPDHTFINTKIIGEAPTEYIWAGIGDALSKQYESSFAARGRILSHSNQLGVDIGHNCAAPLLRYGKQAMDDIAAGRTSEALAEVILNIVVTTGLVSVLVVNDYNSACAHAIYYGSTVLPEPASGPRLHGQVVAYGVLVQLAVDQQEETFKTVYDFNKSIHLPTCLADIAVTTDDELAKLLDAAAVQKDIECVPYPVTRDMLAAAVDHIEQYHKAQG